MRVPESAETVVVRKSVAVAVPVETAFRVFTEEIGAWWPLQTKSVGQAECEELVIEPRVGGRVYERVRGGDEHEWGEILEWEPGSRVVFTWHPGRGQETRQEVAVTFVAEGPGTRVDVEQYGWDCLVKTADEVPDHYSSGWEEILERYAEMAERSR
jgi:uncharacterized protein YndB with AHSA1/START domain